MELKKVIRDFINSNPDFFDDEIDFSDSDNIFEKGFVNSLFAIKLLNFVEKEFKFTVESEDMDIKNFSSVNNIIEFIDRKKKLSAL